MKAVITVTAKDAKCIIAKVSAKVSEYEANIIDISQSVVGEYFAMIMLVDLTDCETPFDELARFLKDKGAERCLDIHVQRQDIFEAMHRI